MMKLVLKTIIKILIYFNSKRIELLQVQNKEYEMQQFHDIIQFNVNNYSY